MTRPPSEGSTITSTTTTSTDRDGVDTAAPGSPERRQLLIRLAAGAVAALLVVTLAVMVLSGRTTTRSAETYCSRMSDTRDLGVVLGTGDSGQIQAAVRQLAAAGRVAPTEIMTAMDLYVDYASQLSDAVASSGQDEASTAAALRAATIAQNDRADEVAAAVTEVDAYVTGTCGFELAPPSS